MRAFSQLLDDLVYTRSRNTKLKLIGDYLRETPDPDRGYGLGVLTGTLDIPHVKPAAVRGMVEERIDPVLFYMSRDYVGDTAETIALLWPIPEGEPPEVDDATIRIADAIERLRSASKMDAPRELAHMLDHLDASGRFALLKLALGALRVGINARLARQALANAFGLQVEAVEEVWHGLRPPFSELFAWAEGRGDQPTARDVPAFRPFMLAHPLEEHHGPVVVRRLEVDVRVAVAGGAHVAQSRLPEGRQLDRIAAVDAHLDPGSRRHAAPRRSSHFSASRVDRGDSPPAWDATKRRTATASVFEYSRKAQPMALRMKNSGSPPRRSQYRNRRSASVVAR